MNAATGAAAEAAKGNLPCLPFELLSGADQVCILYELLSKAGQSISFLLRSAMASSRSCAQTCAHVSLHACWFAALMCVGVWVWVRVH